MAQTKVSLIPFPATDRDPIRRRFSKLKAQRPEPHTGRMLSHGSIPLFGTIRKLVEHPAVFGRIKRFLIERCPLGTLS